MINLFVLLLLGQLSLVENVPIQLTSNNLQSILASNEVLFVNFYANWCRFSQLLNPIYDELARRINEEYPTPGVVAVAKVDCDDEGSIASKYQVKKYPTLKLFRHGVLVKREYRGAREVDALVRYLQEQINSALIRLSSPVDLLHRSSLIVGHFDSNHSLNYQTFVKVANLLRDQCHFALSTEKDPFLVVRPAGDVVYYLSSENTRVDAREDWLSDEVKLYQWSDEKCSLSVREITFENAEELTDEGLPFLLLFHRKEDQHSVQRFTDQVNRQLRHQRTLINCLHADGEQFQHPLRHLGKTINDLPILVIDSFQHMFVFPHFSQIDVVGHLSSFVADFHSGALHQKFHNPSAKFLLFGSLSLFV